MAVFAIYIANQESSWTNGGETGEINATTQQEVIVHESDNGTAGEAVAQQVDSYFTSQAFSIITEKHSSETEAENKARSMAQTWYNENVMLYNQQWDIFVPQMDYTSFASVQSGVWRIPQNTSAVQSVLSSISAWWPTEPTIPTDEATCP